MDSARRRLSGPILSSGSYAKQKGPAAKDTVLASSTFLGHSSGALQQAAAISSGCDVFAGSESDPQCSQITEARPGATQKISSWPQIPPLGSLDPRQSSSPKNIFHLKTYESSIKGIENLSFDTDEKVHY
uniref:Casein kinase n=1 Tax=Rhizophora mucronata TaxID=61149 RepID=A0A2P2PSG2_RHIMU